MALEQPHYGTERITLNGTGPYVIERLIFTDEGTTNLYDQEANNFVTWTGSWVHVQTLGTFDTREQAREFMIDRQALASAKEEEPRA